MKVLIVDDEALARKKLEGLLSHIKEFVTSEIKAVGTAMEALSLMRDKRYDIIFLDIQMPKMSGLQLAEQINHFREPPAIIFITAHDEHAIEAFGLDAADYLTKPVNEERLRKAISRALRLSQAQLDEVDEIVVESQGKFYQIKIKDILCFRSDAKYTVAVTAQGEYLLNTSLTELEQKLSSSFVRVHRSALAAHSAIHTLSRTVMGDEDENEGWAVKLRHVNELLPVSRRQLPIIRNLLRAKQL